MPAYGRYRHELHTLANNYSTGAVESVFSMALILTQHYIFYIHCASIILAVAHLINRVGEDVS